MKLLSLAVITLGSAMVISPAVMAGDAAAGMKKAEACVSCHGRAGRSTNPNNPNLAGQKKNYLIKAMKAYKDGSRKDAMMNSLAAGWSDADIENLAEYFSTVNKK